MDGQKQFIFGTPYYCFLLDQPDMNNGLKEILLSESETQESKYVKSNVGGWRSDFLNDRQEPPFKELSKITLQYFDAMIDDATESDWVCDWQTASWGNVNRNGDFNFAHSHSHSEWSSIYYVDVGKTQHPDPYHSGDLHFIDPRGSLVEMSRTHLDASRACQEMFGTSSLTVKPVTGLLTFFPSWLTHEVLPYRGESPRISIAANYTLVKAEKK